MTYNYTVLFKDKKLGVWDSVKDLGRFQAMCIFENKLELGYYVVRINAVKK